MKVLLPREFKRSTMYSFLDHVIDGDLKPVSTKIDFDFTKLQFIEPSGVTIISNLIEWLFKRQVKVSFTYPTEFPRYNCPVKFLDDSMFFNHYLKHPLRENASTRQTTIPLEKISYSQSYQWVRHNFISWLSGRLAVTTESLDDIRVSLEEIFNNINDHADENIGCIFAQHYPKKDKVMIAISDFGVGIPSNIQKVAPSLNDGEALLKAVQEGFSTKSTPRNRGIGLHHLITNVVEHNKGDVYIHSKNGILRINNRDDEVSYRDSLSSGFYPGTLIEIHLRTDTIENIIIEEEDFSWDW